QFEFGDGGFYFFSGGHWPCPEQAETGVKDEGGDAGALWRGQRNGSGNFHGGVFGGNPAADGGAVCVIPGMAAGGGEVDVAQFRVGHFLGGGPAVVLEMGEWREGCLKGGGVEISPTQLPCGSGLT